MRNRIELPENPDYYEIIDSSNGIWLQYNYVGRDLDKKLGCDESMYSDKCKVHISVAHDVETIKKAQALILPILDKYKIRMFKTQNTERLPDYRNLDGKEFCIYMQIEDKDSQESSLKFWTDVVFKEIEIALKEHHVRENPRGADGDLRFPGTRYFFYRNPSNVSGHYVDVNVLRTSGFTRQEACGISSNDFFQDVLNDSVVINHQEIALSLELKLSDDLGAEVNKQLKERIFDSLKNQLITPTGNLLRLCFGSVSAYQHDHCIIALGKELFGINLNEYETGTYHYQVCPVDPFEKYLDRAADYITIVASQLEKKGLPFDSGRLGSILPAFYFNFYVPLYRSKSNEDETFKEVDIQSLITAIVRGSLRDPNKMAIDYELPQYLYGMDEQQILELYTVAHVKPREGDQNISSLSSDVKVEDDSVADQSTSIDQELDNQLSKIKIDRISEQLESILLRFSQKIGACYQHHSKKALGVAGELLLGLENACDNYVATLKESNVKVALVNKAFKQTCWKLINTARPKLEGDLNWSTYCSNLFKSIANVIIRAFSCGQENHFFTQAGSQSIREVEQVEEKLASIGCSDLETCPGAIF